MIRTLAALLILLIVGPALAQDSEDADRSYFVGFVENQLSTPNRQIRIHDIQGALSSNASIGSITIADRQGIWLRISNARIVWTRSALFTGRLEIDTLAADRIEVIRKPLPEEGMPAPETSSFKLPELPLSINLGKLEVPQVTFGESVFGLSSAISLNGRLSLAGGSLDTGLTIDRLDGPGGELKLAATYANSTGILNVDLTLNEPANGILANLIGIEGHPPVALAMKGAGPMSALDLGLTFDVAGNRVLTGTTAVRREAGGYAFDSKLEGPIATIIPAQFRAFFGTDTALTAAGLVKDGGGFRIDRLNLNSAALTIAAAAETAADGFLQRLRLEAGIDKPGTERVVLPVPGGQTSVDMASLKLSFGESAAAEWSGTLDVTDLATTTFGADKLALTLGGKAENLSQPTERHITFSADGALSGIVATRADVQQALGQRIGLDIEGDWTAGQPVRLANAAITGNGLALSLKGLIAALGFQGDIVVKADSIAPFSELAGRDLAGSLALTATGSVQPLSGGFDLTLDGRSSGLSLSTPAADNVLAGDTRITGRVARGDMGLLADKLRLVNDQLDFTANGTFATGKADFGFDLALADLSQLSERASGRLTAKGRAKGSDGLIGLNFGAEVAEGSLAGKPLTNGSLGFQGTLRDNQVDGRLTGKAALDRSPVTLSSAIAIGPREKRLSELQFSAGETRITGDVAQAADGLLTGSLKLASRDISTAAALLLRQASGALTADIALAPDGTRQNAIVKATAERLVVDAVRVGKATVEAAMVDLFKVPVINGTVSASDVVAGGIDVATLEANAATSGTTTGFVAGAALKNGTKAALKGALTPVEGGYKVGLESLELSQGKLAARLVQPTGLTVEGDVVALQPLTLDVGGGRVTAAGRIAEQLALDVTVTQLPLAIANAIRPDLKLGGTVDADAKIGGTRQRPEVRFTMQGRRIAAAALAQAGLRTLDVHAEGSSSTSRLNLTAAVTSPEGLNAAVSGAVPLDRGDLALAVTLKAFPLAVLDAALPGQALGGSLSGSAKIAGKLADPAAMFDLKASGVTAAPLAAAGAAPLDVTAAGSFANKVLTLSSAKVRGPQGLTLSASGRVPLSGDGLAVSVSGEAPLSLANRLLAHRGAQATGTLKLSADVTGSLARPSVRGMASTVGAQFVDPASNTKLSNISVMASLDGQTVTLRSASAAIGSGGRITASGTVATTDGFPANLRIVLDNARYADGTMVVATLNGALSVTGRLARDPLIAGNIEIARAEITVPENLAGGAAAIDVRHIDPSAAVTATLKRARANDGTPVPTSRPSVVRLDINVNAPRRIFVRGRGLDTELGGSVRLTGPVTDIQPVGAFQLIRGRLSILGQRITFDEGTVTLVGDLDPFLNFVARSSGKDITVFITVTGRVSNPDVKFSSQPELPQDEVLARLIFNRGINELSPIQIAQLAAAAAELAGGSDTSLLGNLRAATGLDDLDIVTDSEGNAAVRAGRYVSDNVYLGVEAGAKGETKGTVNLDITENLKARGAVGTQDSSIGIFYEKDY